MFGYEVSIYAILNGSDAWNGTVLALMQLAGCVGAMLPVWLKLDLSVPNLAYNAEGGSVEKREKSEEGVMFTIYEGEGAVGSQTSVHSSSGYASAAIKSRGLGNGDDDNDGVEAEGKADDDDEEEEEVVMFHAKSDAVDEDDSPPSPALLSPRSNTSSSSRLSLSIALAAVLCSVTLIAFTWAWQLYLSLPAMVIFFAGWQFVSVVYFAKLATHLTEQHALGPHTVVTPSTALAGPSYSSLPIPHTADSSSIVPQEPHSLSDQWQAGGQSDTHNPIYLTHSSTHHPADLEDVLPTDDAPTPLKQPDSPPFSIAVMTVICACVFLQVLVQVVLFSTYQLSLYAVSVILTVTFCLASAVYCAYVLVPISVYRMLR